MNEDPIRSIVDDILASLPASMTQAKDLLSEHLEITLRRAVTKAGLVTRDEFDAQCAVLQRNMTKLKMLEEKISKLEKVKKT